MSEPTALSMLNDSELLTIYERSFLLMSNGTRVQVQNQRKAHMVLRRTLLDRMAEGRTAGHPTPAGNPFPSSQED